MRNADGHSKRWRDDRPSAASGPFGTRVRALREALGWTLRDLGERAGGLSAQYVNDLERGRRSPSEGAARAVAIALGLDEATAFALGGRTPVAIRAYLDAHPDAAPALARLLARAREVDFTGWDEVVHIVAQGDAPVKTGVRGVPYRRENDEPGGA